jgi:putative ABC transport system substrate-binding protein
MRRREFIALLGGAAVTWPDTARAEKAGSSYWISFLALVPEEDKTLMSALLERLHELGYREDTNMVFQYRSAEGSLERLAPLALELVRGKPDVLVLLGE